MGSTSRGEQCFIGVESEDGLLDGVCYDELLHEDLTRLSDPVS